MDCPKCRQPNDAAAHFCRNCGAPLAAPTSPIQQRGFAENKTPWVALLLSWLIPGLGQFYNADMKKGFLILVLWLASLPLVFASGCFLSFIPLGISVWSGIEAYNVAAQKTPLWT